MLKRWAVMLVVMVLVLGSMGAALAEDGEEAGEAKAPLEEGSHTVSLPFLDGLEELVAFVFYWGFDEEADPPADPPDCDLPDPEPPVSSLGFLPPPDPGDSGGVECLPVPVTAKNGKVTHGTLVSTFVHWLKSDDAKGALAEELQDLPKGQLVRVVAGDEFKRPEDGDPEEPELELEEDEEEDGNGPPEWVVEKKANKVKGKKK